MAVEQKGIKLKSGKLVGCMLFGLSAICVAIPAGAATTKPTSIRLSITQATIGDTPAGIATDAQDWKAIVRGPVPTGGQVKFTLSAGSKTFAIFTTSRAHPTECTFTDTIMGTGEKMQATSPDVCSGGVAGYLNLTLAQMEIADLVVKARFIGSPGWSPSISNGINPENVRSS